MIWKISSTVIITAIVCAILELWWSTYIVGGYYLSAGIFFNIIGALVPVVVTLSGLYIMFKILTNKSLKNLIGISCVFSTFLLGCDRGSANVQTLITNDCGVNWQLIPVGQTIPTRMGVCQYKVTIPDYPMQGETSFKTSFKERVLANVEIAYEYSIVDGIKFIGEAKYIGKANTETDDKANSAKQYESAENTVIDKRLREVTTELLINEDIVEFSQSEFEDKLFAKANELLKDKGIVLNFLSFVPTPEEQTRLAIDMMTAMRVYETKGMSDLGKQVAVAKAGSAQINVNAPVVKEDKQKSE